MNRKAIGVFVATISLCLALASCAKEDSASVNEDTQRYFDAWMSVNHPDLKATGNGFYILDDQVGTGDPWDKDSSNFAFVSYTQYALDGTISSTSDEKVAQQLGTYNKSYYYGPVVWTIAENAIYEGIQEAVEGMRVGGTRTVIIPSWLLTYDRYSNASDYLKHSSDVSSGIFTIHLYDQANDIYKWQADSLDRYSKKYLGGIDSTYISTDSTFKFGFYYKTLREPVSTETMPTDTTVYINYIGRLLNGQVFDTNIADTAKYYNIYSSSTTYKPKSITWGSTYSSLTMGDSESSLITGFSCALYKMRPMEKAVTVFYSALGYSYSGSGSMIPAYAPLRFDIELVANPDD